MPFSGSNDRTLEFDEYDNTDRAMNLKLYGHPTHVRRYGKIDYLSKLKSSGFDVKMDTYVNSFSDLEVAKYGLDKMKSFSYVAKGVGKMKISIVGCGYVGCVTGVCFSDMGYEVILVDVDPIKVESINKGRPHL